MNYRLHESADAVVLAPEAPATASVIWLHGLGADGHDFVPIVPELALVRTVPVRFVFPHAPVRPVTLNMGMQMRAWYDIKSLSTDARADAAGLRESASRVATLVDRERAAGMPSARIVVAGFSQGGAVALHAALRYPVALAGVLGLSTYLPLAAELEAEFADANRATPIFMCHGRHDPVLPHALGVAARDFLRERGFAVDWKDYPMQHQVSADEIRDISGWFGRVLA